MLQHRASDKPKRRGSWVVQLQESTQYIIERAALEQFSSTSNIAYNEKMRNCNVDKILPSMFETARLYEDHITRYDLYEEYGTLDPGTGPHISWQAASLPTRLRTQRKRAQESDSKCVPRLDKHDDTSPDETEADDATCGVCSWELQGSSHTRRPSTDETEVEGVFTQSNCQQQRLHLPKKAQMPQSSDTASMCAPIAFFSETTVSESRTQPGIALLPTPFMPSLTWQSNRFGPTLSLPADLSMYECYTGNGDEVNLFVQMVPPGQCDVNFDDIKHTPFHNPSVLEGAMRHDQPRQYSSRQPRKNDHNY